MALTDIYTMVKADRYTQDGREEIIKAQETEVEDRTYNIGEISQKTGLMKTANGWVEPPKGKAKGAKTEAGKPGRDYPILKKEDHMEIAKEVQSNTMPGGSDWSVEEIAKEWKIGKADAEEVKKAMQALKIQQGVEKTEKNRAQAKKIQEGVESYLSKKNSESKPSAPKALKLPDEKSSFQTDVNRMKKLKKEDYKQYTVQLEKLHSKYPINKWKDLLDKTTSDAAPRVLTGDCKIRLKK